MLSVHSMKPVTAARQPSACSADIAESTAAAPDMSIFIAACIGSRRLQADAAGVVHHALADHRQVTDGLGRAVRELDHARRLGAAGVDAEQPAAAEGGEGVAVEDLDVEAGRGGDADGDVGEPARREVAGRRVGEVAGELGGVGEDAPALGATGHRGRPAGRGDEHELGEPGAVGLLLQRRVAVAGEQRRPRRRPGRPPRASPASASVVARRSCLAAARAKAAAASRRPAGVSSAGSPMPTAITLGPPLRGTTSVWPTLPSNPDAASVERSSPTWRGTGPFTPTGTPRAPAPSGTLRATVTATVPLDGRRRVERGEGRARHARESAWKVIRAPSETRRDCRP